MKIIAHRGYWKSPEEQNTLTAFRRAVEEGFGIETDFRDCNQKLVIEHDLAVSDSLPADKAFEIFAQMSSNQLLAINIKADGLQNLILDHIQKFNMKNYFIFDASIPDMLGYIKKDMIVFSRQSEFEKEPYLTSSSQGIWIDAFESIWFNEDIIHAHLTAGKHVCIVSPELHNQSHTEAWEILKTQKLQNFPNHLSLCTDFPTEAEEFFN